MKKVSSKRENIFEFHEKEKKIKIEENINKNHQREEELIDDSKGYDFTHHLSTETSLAIFSYLDTPSLGKACLVSKSWKELVEDKILWKNKIERLIDMKLSNKDNARKGDFKRIFREMSILPMEWGCEMLPEGITIEENKVVFKGELGGNRSICSEKGFFVPLTEDKAIIPFAYYVQEKDKMKVEYKMVKSQYYYFEVKVEKNELYRNHPNEFIFEQQSCFSLGFSIENKMPKNNYQVGWRENTVGYHSDDGGIYCEEGYKSAKLPKWGTGDVVGVGVDLKNSTFFVTHNQSFYATNILIPRGKNIFVSLGIDSFSICDCNFGQKPFVFDLLSFQKDPDPEDFLKIHNNDRLVKNNKRNNIYFNRAIQRENLLYRLFMEDDERNDDENDGDEDYMPDLLELRNLLRDMNQRLRNRHDEDNMEDDDEDEINLDNNDDEYNPDIGEIDLDEEDVDEDDFSESEGDN